MEVPDLLMASPNSNLSPSTFKTDAERMDWAVTPSIAASFPSATVQGVSSVCVAFRMMEQERRAALSSEVLREFLVAGCRVAKESTPLSPSRSAAANSVAAAINLMVSSIDIVLECDVSSSCNDHLQGSMARRMSWKRTIVGTNTSFLKDFVLRASARHTMN